MPTRRPSLSPEEKYQRSVSAKRKFRALVRLIVANLSWLQDIEDDKLGDNVRKNIQVLTRKKGKKSLLTLADKAVLNKRPEERTEAEVQKLRAIIGNLRCFYNFPQDVKDELPHISHFCYFQADRVMVRQDYEPLNMYVILDGEVVVSRSSYDRLLQQQVSRDILVLGAGNYFGDVALLHGTTRMATVTTTQASEFLYIKRDDFDRVLKKAVADMWVEIKHNLRLFSYFDSWSEDSMMSCCILAKKKNFGADQIVLSSAMGESDCVHFVTKGSCYMLEVITVKTEQKRGREYYTLITEMEDTTSSSSKDLKKLLKGEYSRSRTKSVTLRPIMSVVMDPSKSCTTLPVSVKKHFMKIATFKKLACFNAGEKLDNRIVIAAEDTECLLLPRYFLVENDAVTFKAIEFYLNQQLPSTNKIFKSYVQEKKWVLYRQNLIQDLLAQQKRITTNNEHNIPYTIRLANDLGDA